MSEHAGRAVAIDLDSEAIRLFAARALSRDPAYRLAERPVVPPTFLPAGERLTGGRTETDHRFFGPPPRAGDRLTAIRAIDRRDPDGSESLVRYFDRTGGLVAESWSAATETAVAEDISPRSAALLAAYATDWLGAENIRRFRTRVLRALPSGDTVTCSGHVTQHYVQDGEPRVDVTLAGADAAGEIVVRAWASFAHDHAARHG
ncbi:hypothetical protein [Nocardia caishijiensis]|uniref:MaoC dehydratase-like protein n=1 Tax=Nocardia caishijiensis TaxID=184756 RepID=A0ABQ6YGL8_9NOCA|nr:hypothetical protein [Nocardia caishijiensis]KAF0844949.1 hypothetical protein FNL39_110181 [Nocardia caishijiensis]